VDGILTVGGLLAAGREVIIGRLAFALQTQRLMTTTADESGGFSVRLELTHDPRWGTSAFHRSWRVITAYFPGSESEWSTTAFDVVR